MQADGTFANVSVRYGGGFSDDQKIDAILIGSPADPFDNGDWNILTASQEWGPLGAMRRKEEGDLQCAATSWNGNSGDAGVKASFEAVFRYAGLVETFLRNDPSVGLSAYQMEAEFGTEYSVREFSADGPAAVLSFTIHYKARI